MGIFAVLLFAALGYALWSGKIRLAQLPPILLVLGGAMIAFRGSWLLGVAAMVVGLSWYRGLVWRLSRINSKQTEQYDVSKARWLLGVSAADDADRIRARHRQLISENHPDRGGSDERAMELNRARDILLDELARKSG